MILKINKSNIILWYGLSVFFLNSVVRQAWICATGIQLPGLLSSVNIVALFMVIILVCLNIRKYYICTKEFRRILILLILIYIIIVCWTNVSNDNQLGQWVLFASIIPGTILYICKNSEIDRLMLLEKFLKIANSAFAVIFCIGILDYFLGGVVNEFIATYLSDETWAAMIIKENNIYGFRMCTVIGSPLMNAYYALVMLVLNGIYNRFVKKDIFKLWTIYIIGMLTIFLTGSRTALLLGIIFILFSELLDRWGIIKVLLSIAVLFILINTQLFQDTVGARLEIGFMNESDARYNLWISFINNKFGEVKLFTGGGYNYSRTLTATATSTSMNFEYPILMFLFDYGVLATVLYYFIFGGIPLIYMVLEKSYYLMFAYIILFAFLQSCNMAAQYYDFNLQLGFIIMLFVGISGREHKVC